MRSFKLLLSLGFILLSIFIAESSAPKAPQSKTPTACYQKPVSQTEVLLPVAPTGQLCNGICWASALAMTETLMGKPMRQCTLATRQLLADAQTSTTPPPNCCNPKVICMAPCNRGSKPPQTEDRLNELGFFFTLTDRQLTEEEIQQELSNGRPIILHLEEKNIAIAHLVIVNGFIPLYPDPEMPGFETDARYYVIDPDGPADGFGLNDVRVTLESYADLKSGAKLRQAWRATYWHISKIRLDCHD